jgi:nitroreductase
MWRTGEAAYDDTVKAALGLELDDAIVGFMYVGTQLEPPPPRSPRVSPVAAHYWVGDDLDPGMLR